MQKLNCKKHLTVAIKYFTLVLLVIAIIVCSTITLSYLFFQFFEWQDEIRDYFIRKDHDFLLRISKSRSLSFTHMIADVANDLVLLNSLSEDDKLYYSSDLAVEAVHYNSGTSTPEDLSESMYIAPSEITNFAPYALLDYFLNYSYFQLSDKIIQLGFIDAEHNIDYRTPYTTSQNYNIDCPDSPSYPNNPYDITCSLPYKTLNNGINTALVTQYESEQYFLIFKNGTYYFTGFLSTSAIQDLMEPIDGYITFVSERSGDYVVYLDETMPEHLEDKNLSSILLRNLTGYSSLIDEKIVPILNFEDEINKTSIQKAYSKYFAAASRVQIPLESGVYEDSYSTGVLANMHSIISDWEDTVDKIGISLIFQSLIFAFLIIVSLLCTWIVSQKVNDLVNNPITKIMKYFDGELLAQELSKERNILNYQDDWRANPILEEGYNREINHIVDQIVFLDVLTQCIDPKFLLNPDMNVHIENLKKASKVYKGIGNKRCECSCLNLIGNVRFESKTYIQAISLYEHALDSAKELLEDLNSHIDKEKTFREESKLEETTDWEEDIRKAKVNIYKRLQQLVHARIMHIESTALQHGEEAKVEWKKILELQEEALQFAVDAEIDISDVLKLLIDISDTQHNLVFEDSAIDLLVMVEDEIAKLQQHYLQNQNANHTTVYLDIGRLQRIGIKRVNKFTDSRLRINNYTFELDILKQMASYKKGLLKKDNYELQEAFEYFIESIAQGNVYEPEIRKGAATELHNILQQTRKIDEREDIVDLYRDIVDEPEAPCVMFLFAYTLHIKIDVNQEILAAINRNLEHCMTGALSSYIDLETAMPPMIRRSLHDDFINFVSMSFKGQLKGQLCDYVVKAYDMMKHLDTQKYLVIFTDYEKMNIEGSISLDYLIDYLDDVALVVVEITPKVDRRFKEFVEENFRCEYFAHDGNAIGLNYFETEFLQQI